MSPDNRIFFNRRIEMEVPYLIRKSGMYYGHNSCGYVNRALMAELYTKEYAENHASHCDECQAVPLTDALTDADEVEKYLHRIEVMYEVMKSVSKD